MTKTRKRVRRTEAAVGAAVALLPLALACGGQLDVIESEAETGAATGGASSAGGTGSSTDSRVSCTNGVIDRDETNIDCGREACPPCAEQCDCAESERLSLMNCGSTTILNAAWPTPGLLSADGSVFVFTRCHPDSSCSSFEVMRWTKGYGREMLGRGIFSEVMSPDGSSLVLTGAEWEWIRTIVPYRLEEVPFFGRVVAISDDGQVLAATRYPEEDARAGFWTYDTETGFHELDEIPGGADASHATDMSADGTVIVGYALKGPQEIPFIWRAGELEALAALPAGVPGARPVHVSNDGSTMVGVTIESSGPIDVFRWTEADGFDVIAPVCGDSCVERFTMRVSEDGSVVAGTLLFDGPYDDISAFRWTKARGVEHLVPMAEPPPSTVYDMSADGSVIVGQVGSPTGYGHAFVWDAALGFETLEARLDASGVDLSGWEFLGGQTQVSADGNVVVGVGSCGGTQAIYRAVLSED